MFKKTIKTLVNGEFALYKGIEYQYDYYSRDEYMLLYHKEDIDKKNSVHKVTKSQLDGYVSYQSMCEMDDILYEATKIIDNKYCEILSCYKYEPNVIKIKDTSAIWTRKHNNRLLQGMDTKQANTNEIHYAKDKEAIYNIVNARYYFGLDYNNYTGNKHLSFAGDYNTLVGLQTAIKKLYSDRVVAGEINQNVNSYDGSYAEVYFSMLKIDETVFHLDLDEWEIVFLMPVNKNDDKANAFMVEILKDIRKNGIG